MKGDALFENFREVSAKEWKQKIQYDLKGKDYNEEVVWDSPEGIKVKPFYHADDLENINVESLSTTPWRIGQSIYAGNAIMANEKAHKLIKKGIITYEKTNFSNLCYCCSIWCCISSSRRKRIWFR